jgi:hypothetical protein
VATGFPKKMMFKQKGSQNPHRNGLCDVAPIWKDYWAATLLDLAAARSRSITARHGALRLDRFLIMHAVVFGMFGISELHSLNASPVHFSCASALKAKLEVDDSAEIETAKASTKPAWRIVLVKDALIVGSHLFGPAGPF